MKHFLLTVSLAVLFLPGTVRAYVEPEDVLFGNEDVAADEGLHGAASSQRSSRAVSSAVSSEDLHGAAPGEESLTQREERILQRVESRRTSSAPMYEGPSGDTLHSGAPAMSHTGPETTIALALLGIATVATFLFARSGRIDVMQK